MRKKIFRRAVAAAAWILACGCGSTNMQEESAEAREELILWSYYETSAQQEGLDRLVEEFNDSQQKYQISWEYVPIADFTKALSVAVSESMLPDLVLVDNPDMKSLIKTGVFEDITEQLEDCISPEDYYEEVWKAVEYDGCCYGVPFCCNNTAIIYNKQMFQEADAAPPETWEEFKEIAGKLTIEGERYGFVMSAASGEQGAFQFMPWILSTGATGEDLADRSSFEAFRMMKDLIQNENMPNDCMNWSQNDVTRIFLAGKAAMIENGPWALAEIEESGIEYGICPFPKNPVRGVIVGGEDLAVLKGKNMAGAIAFINFYNQKDIMEEICRITRNIPPKREEAKLFGEQNPMYQIFVEQMEEGLSRNSVSHWKKVCRALSDSLYQMFGSEQSAEEIWKRYVKRIQEE